MSRALDNAARLLNLLAERGNRLVKALGFQGQPCVADDLLLVLRRAVVRRALFRRAARAKRRSTVLVKRDRVLLRISFVGIVSAVVVIAGCPRLVFFVSAQPSDARARREHQRCARGITDDARTLAPHPFADGNDARRLANRAAPACFEGFRRRHVFIDVLHAGKHIRMIQQRAAGLARLSVRLHLFAFFRRNIPAGKDDGLQFLTPHVVHLPFLPRRAVSARRQSSLSPAPTATSPYLAQFAAPAPSLPR